MPATKQTFEDYFACGMSAAGAFYRHESQMTKDSSTMMLLADRRYRPCITYIRNMHNKWRKKTKGAADGKEMFDQLEEAVNNYNNNHSKDGCKFYLQRFKNYVDDDPLIQLAVVAPLMARVHSLPQAGEMVFIDASGSLDRQT